MFKRNRGNKTNNGRQRGNQKPQRRAAIQCSKGTGETRQTMVVKGVIRSRNEGQQYNVQKEQGKQDKQ
jgi:hypothetical protein